MKTGVQVFLADFMLIPNRPFYGKVLGKFFDSAKVGSPVGVSAGAEYLKIVERSTCLVNLEGEVGALLIDNRMLGIDDVFVVDVGDDLVAYELDGYDVPFVRLEVIGAFSVAHGKPRSSVVLGGLDEEVISPDMDDRVVGTGSARYQSNVAGSLEAEFEADEGILESRVFVKYSFVATCKLVTAENAVLHLPFFLKKPVVTDLTFREMLTET